MTYRDLVRKTMTDCSAKDDQPLILYFEVYAAPILFKYTDLFIESFSLRKSFYDNS